MRRRFRCPCPCRSSSKNTWESCARELRISSKELLHRPFAWQGTFPGEQGEKRQCAGLTAF